MTSWKDITSFSKSEPRETRQPRAWSLTLPSIRIVITKGHIYHPSRWVMHCHSLGIDALNLCDQEHTAEEAQHQALGIVTLKLEAMLDEVKSIEP